MTWPRRRFLPTGESMNDPEPLRVSQMADKPQQGGPTGTGDRWAAASSTPKTLRTSDSR